MAESRGLYLVEAKLTRCATTPRVAFRDVFASPEAALSALADAVDVLSAKLERAIAFATEAHAGQIDKLGEPYIDHCKRVMDAVSAPAKRVAVLHDVVEDTEWDVRVVSRVCRLSGMEETALSLLTRAPNQTYEGYIEFLVRSTTESGVIANEVKVADLRDNLGRWTPEIGEDLKARYERALERLTKEKTT